MTLHRSNSLLLSLARHPPERLRMLLRIPQRIILSVGRTRSAALSDPRDWSVPIRNHRERDYGPKSATPDTEGLGLSAFGLRSPARNFAYDER